MSNKWKKGDKPFSLAPVVTLLHEHLNEAVCQEVFKDIRDKERQRDWTLHALAEFWLAAIVEAPPALSHLLGRTRLEREGLLPQVMASDSAFYQRCQTLSSSFFFALYANFVESIQKSALEIFAPSVHHLRKRFPRIVIIDGSRLDAIAHRLKILRRQEAVILPGCLTALYDLFRGYAAQLWFDPDAAASEYVRARLVFETLSPGELVLGDRLYCSLEFFDILENVHAFGLFRLKKNLKIVEVECLSREKKDGVLIEDWLVDVGEEGKRLRRITIKKRGKVHAAVTNCLDPQLLSAEDVTKLYPMRWQIERLFYDLKEVLNLHHFYLANPNGVAMQVFAAAMVHSAFRVAQGRIAQSHRIAAEDLSPKKLYPRLATASKTVVEAELYFDRVEDANRRRLKKPDWTDIPKTLVFLKDILVRQRTGTRRRRGFSKGRTKWKSLKHVRGSKRLLN